MRESKLQFSTPVLDKMEFYPNLIERDNSKASVEHEILNDIQRHEHDPKAIVAMQINITAKDENNGEEIFNLSITVKSQFVWSNGMEEKFVEKLLRVNANTLLMSYARPIISQTVSYSGLPPYNIPFLDFSDED